MAKRLRTEDERVVALLHDVIEEQVKKYDLDSADCDQENLLIEMLLEDMATHFFSHGHDIRRLLPDVDILTKRRGDPYPSYIEKIVRYAQLTRRLIAPAVKIADLLENGNPNRNPSGSRLSCNDRKRLLRYAEALKKLRLTFPQISLLSDSTRRKRYNEMHGQGPTRDRGSTRAMHRRQAHTELIA